MGETEGLESRVTEVSGNCCIRIKWKTEQSDSMTMRHQVIDRAIDRLLGFLFVCSFPTREGSFLRHREEAPRNEAAGGGEFENLTVASDGTLEVLSLHLHLL